MDGIKILSTGSYLPEKKVTNDMMSEIVDTSDEWISSRTGIRSRNFVVDEDTSTMAVKAAKNALKNGIEKEKIGVLIVATFSPDYMTPSTACIVQKELELPEQIIAFDLNAACSGFIYALHTAESLLRSMPGKYALVVGSETISKVTDFHDRNTCVLFGDGSGAVVLTLQEGYDSSFFCGVQGSDETIYCKGVQNKGTPFGGKQKKEPEHYIFMNGREVFRFAVDSIQKSVRQLLVQSNSSIEDIDYFVCHQANYRILSSAAKKLGVEEKKFYTNLEHCGNTSAASIPVALNEMEKKGLLKEGMKLICAGFGGGLTYGAVQLKW